MQQTETINKKIITNQYAELGSPVLTDSYTAQLLYLRFSQGSLQKRGRETGNLLWFCVSGKCQKPHLYSLINTAANHAWRWAEHGCYQWSCWYGQRKAPGVPAIHKVWQVTLYGHTHSHTRGWGALNFKESKIIWEDYVRKVKEEIVQLKVLKTTFRKKWRDRQWYSCRTLEVAYWKIFSEGVVKIKGYV